MNTACYSFYSYKGGSGRTTTLLNTAKHLVKESGANPNNPILLVDADLESAGLTYYFGATGNFTNNFNNCIHTCRVLREGEGFLNNRIKAIFEKDSPASTMATSSLIKVLSRCFEKYDIEKLFNGINFTNNSYRFFQDIVDIYYSYNKNPFSVEGKEKSINEKYGTKLPYLISEINQITEDKKMTEEEKIQKKNELISDFLPLYTFLDVSKFFDEPFGTVKFLGVDVHYREGQVTSNDSTDSIEKLNDLCSRYNFKSILFDSGAGTQSSANLLFKTSDVIVCCMRPSGQFISGTRSQLINYERELKIVKQCKSCGDGGEDKKVVVIVPTAVPEEDEGTSVLKKASFESIANIVNEYDTLVDGTFCTEESCVSEVSLFKWHEQILGVKDIRNLSDEVREISDKYASENMPIDAKKAYLAYKQIAKVIVKNT